MRTDMRNTIFFLLNFVCIGTICALRPLPFNESMVSTTPEAEMSSSAISYYLFKMSIANYTQLDVDNPATFADLDSNANTYFIVHGFLSNSFLKWILDMMAEILLADQSANVITVNWASLADFPYFRACYHTMQVANNIAALMDSMTVHAQMDTKKMHLIGHSLGAHVCGLTTSYLKHSPKPKRITGLDPAGPYYYDATSKLRLDKSQADFVDVIHTNGGFSLEDIFHFGLYEPIGHLDFYVNGGENQPGCLYLKEDNLQENWVICSHERSHEYFTESIRKGRFLSQHCNYYNDYLKKICHGRHMKMGFHAHFAHGKYYLQTNSDSPFSLQPLNTNTTQNPLDRLRRVNQHF